MSGMETFAYLDIYVADNQHAFTNQQDGKWAPVEADCAHAARCKG